VAPVHYYRPYYTFYPRAAVGFGIYVGYPFAYSYPFYYPYYGYYPYGSYPYGYYPYDYYQYNSAPPVTPNGYPPYGYPGTISPSGSGGSGSPSSQPAPGQQSPQNANSIGVQPGQSNMGGLSFDITPNTAQLFIDSIAMGTVGQFTTTTQPLGVTAGRHQIEVRAPGYQTISFEVDIVAGQVIPYQGTMER